MRIDLGDYILKSDSSSFIIAVPKKVIDKETGLEESVDDNKWFYSNFYQMVEGLARRKLLKSDATTLSELSVDLRKITMEVVNIREQFKETEIKEYKPR